MPRAKREARTKTKARPKETGRTGTRINRPDLSRESVSQDDIDGRMVYQNLAPHVQRHFDHVVSYGIQHGHPFVDCVQVAMDECSERYVWNMVAVVMDLHEATNDSEDEQRLRAFRATGANYDTSLESYFPLFRGAPPANHPYPGAFTDSPANVPGSGYIPFAGHGRRLESPIIVDEGSTIPLSGSICEAGTTESSLNEMD